MDKEFFEKIMNETAEIALATCADGMPNVRIVSYAWANNKIYFFTFKGKTKVAELDKNKNVAFTTIPKDSIQFVRANKATCERTSLSVDELKEIFIAKNKGLANFFAQGTENFEFYEIVFTNAELIKNVGKSEIIEL